jgi:hypothetical protein
MIFVTFPCGDLQQVTILKKEGNQVCVSMPFGPFWTDEKRIGFSNETSRQAD